MAVLTAGQAERSHHPLFDATVDGAWRGGTPPLCKKAAIVYVGPCP
jgi:hypothetical protein